MKKVYKYFFAVAIFSSVSGLWGQPPPPPPPTPPSPIVSSFMPEMGEVGTNVTITGQNFSDTPEENTITFGGGVEAGVPSSATTTSLTVQVPSGATTGLITVTVDGQAGTSQSNFTVPGPAPPTPPAPIVSSFVPEMGEVGEAVVITGQNFSDVPAENTITFGGGVEAGVPSSATTTSLTVNVPQNAVTGPITVTVYGQTGTSQSNFTVPPIVSRFTPNEGAPGTTVVITGKNFSDVPAENTITFGGGVEAGVPSSATTTSLTVQVPQNADTGPITVTVYGQTGTSQSNFTVPVAISKIDPESGAVGDPIEIIGTGFSATAAENTVTFLGDESDEGDNQVATISEASTTKLVVNVPDGAVSGPIEVEVNGVPFTSYPFTVFAPLPIPIVLSFMPEMGTVGTLVTITGDNFSATSSENTVTFGGIVAPTPSVATTTSLTVQVPEGAQTGPITVTVDGQTGISQSNFTVLALVVSSFTPNAGAPGTTVVITGENFSDVAAENMVDFGGTPASTPSVASYYISHSNGA